MSIARVRNYPFQDEFNGPAGAPPDPAKWVHETGRWTDNNELETYTSSTSNCCLDGQGRPRIRALKTARDIPQRGSRHRASSRTTGGPGKPG